MTLLRLTLATGVSLCGSLLASSVFAQDYGGQQSYGDQQGQGQYGQQQGQYGQQGQGYGGQQGSNLQAGGLAPPGSVEEPQQEPTDTERELDEAEKEDSGRGLEFIWLGPEVGYEYLNLQTFKVNNIVDAGIVKSSDAGMVYGGGLGLRLIFITLGARFRLGDFTDWNLWTLNAELGLRIPLGRIEPYFTAGAGYASLGSFSTANIGPQLNSAGVGVTGYDVRVGGGLDIYLTSAFSIGGSLTGELLGLTWPGADLSQIQAAASGQKPQTVPQGQQLAANVDGSTAGTGVTLALTAGLHF